MSTSALLTLPPLAVGTSCSINGKMMYITAIWQTINTDEEGNVSIMFDLEVIDESDKPIDPTAN